ncbi:MAG TPA: hypothetical protein VIY96_06645 [Thermoanaerobaculia bacterium]
MSRRIGLAVGALSVLFPLTALPESATNLPGPGGRTATLLTLGGAYTMEAGGCERHSRNFRVSSRRPIDVSKVEKGQIVSGVYLRQRDHAGRAGWRNVSVSADGHSVDFELFAEGTGRFKSIPSEGRQCVEATPARVVVDLEAWVLDP